MPNLSTNARFGRIMLPCMGDDDVPQSAWLRDPHHRFVTMPRSVSMSVEIAEKPQIEGHYIDNFGSMQEILDHYWVSGQYSFQICSIDNTKHQIIALNEAANEMNAGKFSRFDWVQYGNRIWYCQTVYNADTEGEAAAAPPADAADPRTGGCGGKFEWSSLSKLAP